LAAALFCLTVAGVRASAENIKLHIGPGVNDPCYAGGGTVACPHIWQPENELNEIPNPTLDIYSNAANKPAPDRLLLIVGVPVENLLLSAPSCISGSTCVDNDPLSLANIVDLHSNGGTQALLYQDPTFPWGGGSEPASTPVDVTLPGAPPYVSGTFAQGDLFGGPGNPDLYSFLGADGNNSHHYDSYAQADVDVPLDLFGINVKKPSGFSIWIFVLDNLSAFEGNDAIRVDFAGIPIGSFVVPYGQRATDRGYDTFQDAITEAGLVMPPPPDGQVPEPCYCSAPDS
jgi:hypothetical protein